MKNLRILSQDLLRFNNSNKRPLLKIAIVGNSGVHESDEAYISNADMVVRFNNYGTRAGIAHTKDPLRCDVLFSTFDLHSNGSKPKDVVIGIPYPFKAKEIIHKPNRWYPQSRHWMVNPYENMKLCEELGLNSLGFAHPLPSIGFTALWHMHTWRSQFYICGFQWYYDQEKNKFQNWDLRNKEYPKTWNHNYCKEVEWCLKNLRNKHNINFSDRCNQILDAAERQLK